jgi:hypothetical protein
MHRVQEFSSFPEKAEDFTQEILLAFYPLPLLEYVLHLFDVLD